MSRIADEALCPGCCKPADMARLTGWRFVCFACCWDWGHPQDMTYEEAQGALHDARCATDRATAPSSEEKS